jgi:hypothetical protein
VSLEETLRRIIREEVAAALREHFAQPVATSPPREPDGRAVYTLRELTQRWAVSPRLLDLMRADGRLSAIKLGSRVLIPVAEVQRIESQGGPDQRPPIRRAK